MRADIRKVRVGKVVAGCGAAAMLAVLGVVAVQAQEVSPCWADFDSLTDTTLFPDGLSAPLVEDSDNPAVRAALADPGYRKATVFTGDAAIGAAVWTVVAPGPLPHMADEFGLLPARAGAAARDVAMYEGRNGKRHWMRSATRPVGTFMKNLRALTFVPQSDGSTQVMGADARSGYAQWCRAVPVAPTVADPERDPGWVTGETGNGRTVLMVGAARHAAVDTSQVVQQDTVSGKVTRSWPVDGRWTDVASDGRRIYLAAPGTLAAVDPGARAPRWTLELPGGGGEIAFTSVDTQRLLVGTRPVGGGPGTLTAVDPDGRRIWTLRGTDPAEAIVTGDTILVHESRGGADGIAAYRLSDATPVWFTAVADLPDLADAGTDGTLLYLPGRQAPRVLRVADGQPVASGLTLPADRVFVTGQRIVVEHTVSADLAWMIAFTTPKAAQDTTGSAGDPRRR